MREKLFSLWVINMGQRPRPKKPVVPVKSECKSRLRTMCMWNNVTLNGFINYRVVLRHSFFFVGDNIDHHCCCFGSHNRRRRSTLWISEWEKKSQFTCYLSNFLCIIIRERVHTHRIVWLHGICNKRNNALLICVTRNNRLFWSPKLELKHSLI